MTFDFLSVQGLAQIAQDVATLAAKAREGKLQPQEFQVRTLLNVKDFSNHCENSFRILFSRSNSFKLKIPRMSAADFVRGTYR